MTDTVFRFPAPGAEPLTNDLDGWVKVEDTASGLNISIDVDGAAGAKGMAIVATLDGYHGPFVAGTDWLFH